MAAPPYGPGGPGYPAMPPIMSPPRPTVSNPLMGATGAPGWANPLMYAGLGLLSQGPSLTPQSPLQGLVPGLQMGMQANALAAEQARQNEMLELRREEAAAKREEREAATEAERVKREASIRRLAPIVGGPEAAADVYAAGAAEKYLGPTKPETLKAVVGPGGTPIWAPASEAAGQPAASLPSTSISIGGEGQYEPQTDLAKTAADLAHHESLPPEQRNQAVIDSLRAKLNKATQPTAEVAEREGKYKSAGDAMNRMMTLADQPEYAEHLGPIAGRKARVEVALGTANRAQAALVALESTMMTRLGTALSGAAIPESEWPKYESQVPSVIDSPEGRAGKAEQFLQTLQFLEEEAARRRGEAVPVEGDVAVPATEPPADLSGASTEELLNMIAP